MPKQKWLLITLVLATGLTLFPALTLAQATEEPVVRAVLFFSPTCPHCHAVINDVLTPLVDRYGGQLQIIGIDISQAGGHQLFHTALDQYQISTDRQGVPMLIIEETVLVGSQQIPQEFPTLVEEKLATGGTVWPDLPGLAAVLPTAAPAEATSTPAPPPTLTPTSASPTVEPSPSPTAQFAALPTIVPTTTPTNTPVPAALTLGNDPLPPAAETPEPPADPVGLTLAGVVLVSLLTFLVYAFGRLLTAWPNLFRSGGQPLNAVQTWLIPLLALVGLGVSLYLAHVEINQVAAICGPVGECNLVQASSYARILGVPVAALGVLNYLVVLTLWLGRRCLPGDWATLPALGLLGLSLAGVLFSIYLTWLELFVIRAVCLWCLSSAVITLILLFLVMPEPAAAKPQRELSPQ